MEQIFVVTTKYQLCNSDMSGLNKFLKENPHYTVKHIVPIAQYGSPCCYGVAITVGEK